MPRFFTRLSNHAAAATDDWDATTEVFHALHRSLAPILSRRLSNAVNKGGD